MNNFINKFINRNPTRKKEIAYHDKLANAATVATMASTAENTPEKESVRQNHLVAKLHNEQVIKPADPRQLVENAAFLKANSIFANDTLENLLRNIVVKLQRIQLIDAMDTIRHDSIYQEYVKQKLQTQDVDVAKQPPNIGENKMTGGYELNKINQVRESLDKLLSDSFHDFGKGRNRYFPYTIYANRFVDVKHEKIQALIHNIYHGSYTQKDHPDFLYNYLLGSKFEEQIKVDFLTGDLVGDISDISYFFSESGPMNWPSTRQDSIKDAIIGEVARTKMGEVINKNSVGDWYYIYDACVPGRIHANLGGKQALTLSKIWDPSKASKIQKSELFESINTASALVSEGTHDGYTIFDWIRNERNRKSLYDEIYSDLLHIETLSNKSLIKLRMALSDDEMCSLCIKIADKHFIIDSGFSVNELSAGIYYVEMSGKIKQTEIQKTQTIKVSYLPPDMTNPSLRIKKLLEIIDELKDHMNKEQIISTLLRFKSSGDHGQSKMCQIINHELKEFCMFVSGDNLACVEAISLLDIPVLMRYYSPSNSTKDDDDDDDDEAEEEDEGPNDVCEISGKFFICLYLPVGNNHEKLNAKIVEQVDRIQDLLYYWVERPVNEPIITIITNLNNKIEVFFNEPFDINTEQKRDALLSEAQNITSVMLESLKNSEVDIDVGKKQLQLLKSFADNLYLLYFWQTNGFQRIYNQTGVDNTILEQFDQKLDAASANLKRKKLTTPILITSILESFEGRTTINPTDLYNVPELTQLRNQLDESFKADVSRLKSEFSLNDENMEKVKNIVRDIKKKANMDLLQQIENIKIKGIGLHLYKIIENSLLKQGPEISSGILLQKNKIMTISKKLSKLSKKIKISKISKKPKKPKKAITVRRTTQIRRGKSSTRKESKKNHEPSRKYERSVETSPPQKRQKTQAMPIVVFKKNSNKGPKSRNSRPSSSKRTRRATIR